MSKVSFENIDLAQRCISKLILKYGYRKLRRKLGRDRHRLGKVVRQALKRGNLIGTSVEGYYEKQFKVALLGLEAIWLPAPHSMKVRLHDVPSRDRRQRALRAAKNKRLRRRSL